MDIIYLAKTSIISDTGGAELRTDEETQRVAQRGHNVTVLCGLTRADLPKETTTGNRTICHIRCLPKFCYRSDWVAYYLTSYLFPFVSLPVLLFILLEQEIDVIVDTMTPYPTFAILAGKATGTPVVGIVHGFFDSAMYQTYDPLTATIQLTVQNFLRVFQYARLIVPTNSVRQALIKYGIPERRVVVIPNGVDFNKYAPSDATAPQGTGPPTDEPVRLIVIGRVTETKGQSVVVRAFKQFQSKAHIDTTLHIVGSGPTLPQVQRLVINLGLSDSVYIHGNVSEEEKIKLIRSSTLFVYASQYESFGIVLLEALAAGLPIVAVNQPAYHDFFNEGRHGELVANSPEAIATGVQNVLMTRSYWTSDARYDRLTTARTHSWENIAYSTERILQTALKTNDEHLSRGNSKTSTLSSTDH